MSAADKVSLRSQLVSGLQWVAATRLLIQVTTWAVTLVVIRILSPGDYGLLAMANVFIALMLLLAEGGAGLAVIQAARIDDIELRKVFGLVIVINLSLFVGLVACAPLIAHFFREPRLVPIVCTLAIQFVVMIFAAIPNALLTRHLKFRAESLVNVIGTITGAVTTLTLALLGFGVWALVIGSLVSAVVGTLCVNILSPFIRLPILSLAGMQKLVMFGGHVTLSRVLSFTYQQADNLIGGKFLGRDLLGTYAVAIHLASLPAQRISSVLNPVVITAFARIQEHPSQFSAYFARSLSALFLLSVPVCWGMSAIAEELVFVILGEKWLAATVPFKLLALIMPLRILSPFINSANFGMGQANIVSKSLLLVSCFMVPAYLVGVQWGVIGLTLAWVAIFPLAFGISLFIALPSVGLAVPQVVRALIPVATCGIVMYVAVTAARLIMPPDMLPIVRMVALIGVGGAVFVAFTWLINRDGLRDAIALARKSDPIHLGR